MALYLEDPQDTFTLWVGQELPNGNRYPLVIENLWSEEELAEANLFKPVAANPTPPGKSILSTEVKRINGVVKYVNTFEDTPELEPVLAGPPVLRASALGLKVSNGDFEGIPNSYNVGGAIYFDVGNYLMFFIDPIPEPYVPIFITDGPHSVNTTLNDEYSMMVEVTADGVPTDPNILSVQVYQR